MRSGCKGRWLSGHARASASVEIAVECDGETNVIDKKRGGEIVIAPRRQEGNNKTRSESVIFPQRLLPRATSHRSQRQCVLLVFDARLRRMQGREER
jgi:hypothetical protein